MLPSAPRTIAARPATACELGQHVSRALTRIAWLVRARLQMADGTRGHVGSVGAAQRCPVPARAQLARSDCHGKRCAPARVQLDSKLVLAHPMNVSLRRRRLAKEIPPPPSPAASATPRRLARMSASGGCAPLSLLAATQLSSETSDSIQSHSIHLCSTTEHSDIPMHDRRSRFCTLRDKEQLYWS